MRHATCKGDVRRVIYEYDVNHVICNCDLRDMNESCYV